MKLKKMDMPMNDIVLPSSAKEEWRRSISGELVLKEQNKINEPCMDKCEGSLHILNGIINCKTQEQFQELNTEHYEIGLKEREYLLERSPLIEVINKSVKKYYSLKLSDNNIHNLKISSTVNASTYTSIIINVTDGSPTLKIDIDARNETDALVFIKVVSSEKSKPSLIYNIKCEEKSRIFIQNYIECKEKSDVFNHWTIKSNGHVRCETESNILDSESNVTLNGFYYADNGKVEFMEGVNHRVKNSTSNQLFRGILDNSGFASFQGKIRVFEGADDTNAMQSHKAICVDNKSNVYTKPELEIFADEVICSHGATVGGLDPAALFYLGARGVDPVEAQKMLLEAFAMQTTEDANETNYKLIQSNIKEVLL